MSRLEYVQRALKDVVRQEQGIISQGIGMQVDLIAKSSDE